MRVLLIAPAISANLHVLSEVTDIAECTAYMPNLSLPTLAALTPPDVTNVAAADKETFSDLQARYTADAKRAASTWKSAGEMNARLASQHASLNADTAAAVARFQLLFGLAAGSMLDRRWDEVTEHLQAVEAETAKVAKVVGR